MTIVPGSEPLTVAELERLQRFLEGQTGGEGMNLEELDGFFAALVAGPTMVMPSEYLPHVFGQEEDGSPRFESVEEANEILALLMRHWNEIAETLSKGETHRPLLIEDEKGDVHGNDWANGFVRGTRLRHEGWAELLEDEAHGGCMIPMLALYHEHDEDPSLRPGPISPGRRQKILESMALGLGEAYRHFQERGEPGIPPIPPQRSRTKIGRNDPCPCGSGKKYKRCCGDATVH